MRTRAAALSLLVLGLALAGGWVWPTWGRLDAVRQETELARQQGERTSRRRARPLAPATSAGETSRRLRGLVLAVVDKHPVRGVVLEVLEHQSAGRAGVKLAAEGGFTELAGLAGDLAGAPGLALSRVDLSTRGESSRLELEASAW